LDLTLPAQAALAARQALTGQLRQLQSHPQALQLRQLQSLQQQQQYQLQQPLLPQSLLQPFLQLQSMPVRAAAAAVMAILSHRYQKQQQQQQQLSPQQLLQHLRLRTKQSALRKRKQKLLQQPWFPTTPLINRVSKTIAAQAALSPRMAALPAVVRQRKLLQKNKPRLSLKLSPKLQQNQQSKRSSLLEKKHSSLQQLFLL
jgi:hypothetical protein